jgi:hypothetical protein
MSYFQKLGEVAARNMPCHVCSQDISTEDQVIEHGGPVNVSRDGYGKQGGIAMHPECAAILGMRLLHDVVKQPGESKIPQGEARVMHLLRDARRAYQMKG